MTQFGFSGLNNRTSDKGGINTKPTPLILVGRVSDIILDESHKDFNKENTLGEGGWSSLGNIYFTDLTINGPNTSKPKIARPLSPNIKNPPLKNELVYIFSLPDKSSQENSLSSKYYYSNIISIWNHPLHNANPFSQDISKPGNKSYSSVSITNKPGIDQTKQSDIDLGAEWINNKQINPLYSYLGDYLIEGRFNNSIRLGSTIRKSTNNWSNSGNEGDPIIILRNSHLNSGLDPWIPQNEDINKDDSSIYITSTQKIPLKASNETYRSIIQKEPVKSISEYDQSQIILSSGRLILNSKLDSIYLFSGKSIGLSSLESIGLTSNNITLDSSKIFLGNKNATESVLLGDKTVTLLLTLLKSLDTLCLSLEGAKDWPKGEPAAASPIRLSAQSTRNIINDLKVQLNSIKSKTVKTI